MNVLVLGGTGAMGAHLVDLLAARGDTVTVTSRKSQHSEGSIRFITGNAKEPAFVKQLLGVRWDAIVDFMVYSTAEFGSRAQMLLGATSHYLYLSSARVYSESATPITEDTPRLLDVSTDTEYLSTDEYALTKARQENILFQSPADNWTIIRPYITYSTYRLQLGVLEKEEWLYRIMHGRSVLALADIQKISTTLTHGVDVAKGMAALIGNPLAFQEAFNITASQPILWSEVLDTYLDVFEAHTGKRPTVRFQELPAFIRWQKKKYQIIYDRLFNRRFNNEKINQFLNASSFTPPQTGLSLCLEEFLQINPAKFGPVNWRAEALKDKFLKEHTPLTEVPGSRNKLQYILYRHSRLGLF